MCLILLQLFDKDGFLILTITDLVSLLTLCCYFNVIYYAIYTINSYIVCIIVVIFLTGILHYVLVK